MGEVRNFRGQSRHLARKCMCDDGNCFNDYGRGCAICEGGLFVCAWCGAGEGAVATDCPRVRTTASQDDEVYAGTLDYISALGGWVRVEPCGRKIRCEEV